MGRALAVSKLQNIKSDINNLSINFKKEEDDLQSEVKHQLEKKQPEEVETATLAELKKKSQAVIKQIPSINLIEDKLGIQEDDPELATLSKSI